MNQSQSGLKKELKTRHMTMISIAGVIGAGLFVGSGSVIHSTGPGGFLRVSRIIGDFYYENARGDVCRKPDERIVFSIRSRRHRTVGRIYNRLAVLVFLGDRHRDRSHCRCWHYSILVP